MFTIKWICCVFAFLRRGLLLGLFYSILGLIVFFNQMSLFVSYAYCFLFVTLKYVFLFYYYCKFRWHFIKLFLFYIYFFYFTFTCSCLLFYFFLHIIQLQFFSGLFNQEKLFLPFQYICNC